MDKSKHNGCPTSTAPLFSVVIAVFNDWAPLEQCLRSLAQQENAPEFEVIVVDDGSDYAAPDCVRKWACRCPLRFARQSHAGIAAARNHGIRLSKGSLLVFTDADCRLRRNCLESLAAVIARSPRHDIFQLRLIGDCSNLVGQAEELRLSTLQKHMLQPTGCIRYLNTAGFAIRRARVNIKKGLFDPAALRAEDTLLLASVMQNGELPLFVSDAIIQHAITLSLMLCLAKDLRSACLEAKTDLMITSTGVQVRMRHRERLRILCSAWKASRHGRSAWFILICRKTLRRMIGLTYRSFLHSLSARRRGHAHLHIHLDQRRPLSCETLAKRTSETIDRGWAASGHPHASGQQDPVEVGTSNLEHT